MDIHLYNRWSGSYVIQPRHMGGFYSKLLKRILTMSRTYTCTHTCTRTVILCSFIFILSSIAGCASIAALNIDDIKDALILSQPVALMR